MWSYLKGIFVLIFSFFVANSSWSQCNTNTTICDNNSLAGPFPFQPASANPSSCLDYWNGAGSNNYAYIILYITQGGDLNLLVDGNAGNGFLDVSIFDITGQTDPCASLSTTTEISCNYASASSGCAQFGTTFPCPASVPAPSVTTGDVIMILVEDWSNNHSNFTLDLSNTPGSAQTGPPNATITPVGPFCDDAGPVQLDAVNMGGTWTGPGVNANGVFDPAAAGVGTHTINYSIGSAPCDDQDQITIQVDDCNACFMTFFSTNISACDPADNTFSITGTVEFDTPPTTGQLIVQDCNGNQQTFNAPFTSPTNYALTGIDSDGTQNCTVTAFFTDDPNCEITSNPFNYPEECFCETEIGSFNESINGSTNTTGPYLLCFDDELDIIGNGDFVAPQNFNIPGVTYDPGVWLFVYNCPPTVFEPDDLLNDPCLLGVASTNDQAWTIWNDAGGNGNVYFMPVTMYSMTDGIYAISLNNGDFCYETGPVYDVTFLNEIEATIVEDCQAGTAAVTITGGQPELNGSNFTISNLQPASANLSSNTTGHNGTVVISGLEDGDAYSFDIVDASGCPHSISGVFQGVEDASFDYPSNTYCNTQNNPTANVTGTPGGTFTAAPAGLTIDPNSGLIDLSSATGTFTITYQTPDPVCFETETFVITINPEPQLDAIQNEVVCDAFTFPAITGTDLIGNEAFFTAPNGGGTQYNPGDAVNFGDFTSYPVTLYAYSETGTVPNCSDETSFQLTILETPELSPIADAVVCDEFTFPAIAGNSLTGNEAFYDAPNGGGNTFNPGDVVTNAGTTTYYIYDETGTNPNCFDEESFQVTINLTPDINPLANQEVCDVFELPAITGNNLTGNEAYYDAANGAGAQLNPGDQITAPGTNTFYIYDATGTNPNCLDETSFTVTVNVTPDIAAIPDAFECDEFTLPAIVGNNLTGNESFYDAPNGGGSSFNAGDVITDSGTSTFYVYDETGTTPNCFDEISFDVTINETPILDAIADQVECDQYTLPAISGTNLTGNEAFYDAPNGAGTTYNAGDVFSTPGTTTLYVYDETGGNPNCSDEISFEVTINVTPTFTVNYTDPTECALADGTIIITGLEPNTAYSVSYESGGTTVGPVNLTSDGNGEIVITGLAAGSYSNVTVELNGCSATDPTVMNLEEPNAPAVDAGQNQTVCEGTPVTLTANNPDGANITWNNGVVDGDPFTPAVGSVNYTVTAELDGCISTDQVNVTVNPLPTIGAGNDLTVCDGDEVTLTANNPDGAAIAWDNGVNDGVPFTPGVGTITYTVTADLQGCISTDEVDVTVLPNPTYTVSGTDPTECGAFDGTVIISGLVPNENYSYNYNNTGLQNATANANGEIIITGLNAGSYSDFIVIWNGCETPDNTVVNLVDPNAPFVSAGPDITVCDGDEITLVADNPDGAIITWDNGVTDGNPFTQPVGTVTYTVTADLDNCISTDQMNVTVNPLPNVSAGNDVIVCEGESEVLTGSGAQSYTWDNGVVNGQSFVPTQTTTYTVTGVSADGCENTDQVVVEVDALPAVGFEVDNTEGCVPVTATFTPAIDTAGVSCTWIMGDGSTIEGCGEFAYTYNTTGCFTVTLLTETVNGCSSTQTQPNVVCVGGFPQAGFSYSPDQPSNILNTVNFTNGSVGAVQYEWSFGDGETSTQTNPTHTYDENPNEYEVILVAISQFGCTDTAVRILPLIEELIYYVPNTITPNNDGVNDVFKPIFTSGFNPLEYNLLIFNRWGEVVFESNNAEVGWDGTYGASSTEIVKDGTYVWKISYQSNQTGRKEVITGHVNVLK